LYQAISDILKLTVDAFKNDNIKQAELVEPLEQVVDDLNLEMKNRHIARLQKNECTIEQGFIFSDLLTNLERVSDHVLTLQYA
jgi:phosphate:Na+ symporter